jgi:hypothetical protein
LIPPDICFIGIVETDKSGTLLFEEGGLLALHELLNGILNLVNDVHLCLVGQDNPILSMAELEENACD